MDVEEVFVKEEVELQEEKPDLQEISQELQGDTEDNKDFIITVEDFPYICRVCCQRKSDLRPFEDEQYLLDLFHAIRKTDVLPSLKYPKNICEECVDKLKEISLFIEIWKCDTKPENNLKRESESSETVERETSYINGVKIEETNEEYKEDTLLEVVCRFCSCPSDLTSFEGKNTLMQLFQDITNIDVKAEITTNGNKICNSCIAKMEDNISSFINVSLNNEEKLERTNGRNEPVKTERFSSLMNDLYTCKKEDIVKSEVENNFDENIGIDQTSTDNVSDIAPEHETVYIKEEIFDSDLEDITTRTRQNIPKKRSSQDLQGYSLSNTKEKNFQCDRCQKSCSTEYNLKRHLPIHEEKQFKCGDYKKSFKKKKNLKLHLPTHTEDKPFKCDLCVKSFARKHGLKMHLLAHTGEKPYVCDFCNKTFVQSSSLNLHLRTHSGEKPFKCDSCEKSFNRKHHLQIHLSVHTGEKPFECDYCNKGFTHSTALNIHMRKHCGEKTFKCSSCDKSYSNIMHQIRHSLTCTGEKTLNVMDTV